MVAVVRSAPQRLPLFTPPPAAATQGKRGSVGAHLLGRALLNGDQASVV